MTSWPEAQLLAALATDRYRLPGRRAEPAACHVTRWPRAVPIYTEAVLDAQKRTESPKKVTGASALAGIPKGGHTLAVVALAALFVALAPAVDKVAAVQGIVRVNGVLTDNPAGSS